LHVFEQPSWIDGSLYPDTEIPEDLLTLADRVDFLVPVQINLLSPLWGFGSWLAPNPGAYAPGYTLAPLRGYGGPLHPAPKGRSRKAWGVSPR
jgi:hypothetical protein